MRQRLISRAVLPSRMRRSMWSRVGRWVARLGDRRDQRVAASESELRVTVERHPSPPSGVSPGRPTASKEGRNTVSRLLQLPHEDAPKLGKSRGRRVGENVDDPLAIRRAERHDVVSVLDGQLKLCGQVVASSSPASSRTWLFRTATPERCMPRSLAPSTPCTNAPGSAKPHPRLEASRVPAEDADDRGSSSGENPAATRATRTHPIGLPASPP